MSIERKKTSPYEHDTSAPDLSSNYGTMNTNNFIEDMCKELEIWLSDYYANYYLDGSVLYSHSPKEKLRTTLTAAIEEGIRIALTSETKPKEVTKFIEAKVAEGKRECRDALLKSFADHVANADYLDATSRGYLTEWIQENL